MKKLLVFVPIILTACSTIPKHHIGEGVEIHKILNDKNITVEIANYTENKATCSIMTNKRVILLEKEVDSKEVFQKEVILKKKEQSSDINVECV